MTDISIEIKNFKNQFIGKQIWFMFQNKIKSAKTTSIDFYNEKVVVSIIINDNSKCKENFSLDKFFNSKEELLTHLAMTASIE